MAEAEVLVIDNELLIHLVQERPVLWDKTIDTFKDRNATRSAWREVCLQFRNDFDELEDNKKNAVCKEIMKRWKHLRDAFAKSEKKDKESKKSGSQASKKRKYIFNDELQFLRKIYQDRNTDESYNNEDGENKDDDDISLEEQEDSVQSVTSKVTPVVSTSATGIKETMQVKTPRRQHKKMDEVDLKIIKAIEKSEQEEKKDSKLSFFESLLPHLNKFNDNEWLQCQVEILQVISKMNNRYLQAPPPPPAPPAPRHHELHNPPASQFQVIAQPQNFNFPQQPYYGQMHHQAYSSNMHSQVSPTPGAQLVQPVQVPQVPKGAQPKSTAVTSQRSLPQVSKPKSPVTLHYESFSQFFDDDDGELSRASSSTIDFTELP
ncbi:uncharacterized protein LOC128996970 [Macrosteles quadrilineatus]|uniref:uncharacterized protein LOC128994666 n=1 Tax=Macrosteles quadrilineatus TaxID=74068 RepID=UPI0023E1B677|nr:uncharacterized protein LOC128994666 [Macrosteles quadrilineatus]XP_054278510.1 uncharacterized protein LOC128996970 [Macrosteles quadrilineatus]